MSITIGIYDLFAYTIPGLFYLFVIYRFMALLNVNNLAIPKIDSIYLAILAFVAAYFCGHIFDAIRQYLWKLIWHKVLKKPGTAEIVLEEMKEKFPELPIHYDSKEAIFLLTTLRVKSHPIAQYIDKLQADALMLRNLGLGFGLFSILQFFYCLQDNFQPITVGLLAGSIILSAITHQKGYQFHRNFYVVIFQAAQNYGINLSTVLRNPANSR